MNLVMVYMNDTTLFSFNYIQGQTAMPTVGDTLNWNGYSMIVQKVNWMFDNRYNGLQPWPISMVCIEV